MGTGRDDTAADPQRVIEELRRERDEALAREAALAEVLGVINSSPGDLAPVFEAIVERTIKLCDAEFTAVARCQEDGLLRLVATNNLSPDEASAFHSLFPRPPTQGFIMGRAFLAKRAVSIDDVLSDAGYDERTRQVLQSLTRYRSFMGVPIVREGKAIGVIGCARREVKPFTQEQIELVSTFADHAVIAIENARLLTETRERTAELQEALEFQTATSDVLKVISRSTFDLAPVLEYVIETAIRLCRAHMGSIFRLEDGTYRWAVGLGLDPAYREVEMNARIVPGTGTLVGRVALEGRTVHITDADNDPLYEVKDEARLTHANTMLGVPLMREGSPIGVIAMARDRVEPFSENEIALVATFADQAVIAIENVRLFNELNARTHDLQEALSYQTATGEVLRIVASSPDRLAPVFDAILDRAMELCEVKASNLYLYEDGAFTAVAARHPDPQYAAEMLANPVRPGPGTAIYRAFTTRMPVHIRDIADDGAYGAGNPFRVRMVERGVRAVLIVPLVRGDQAIGAITIYRPVPEPYSEAQIELVRTFADQAVVAIENARLFGELRAARDAAEAAYRDLQAAQSSLVQAQKMAALGQLTAGIAHEIKNPLNFVNNFAGLSTELLDELKEDLAPALAGLDEDKREAIGETIELLTGNLDKIAGHGRRADNIVKSMLEHSRGVSGEKRAVDLNALIDEALNLAYHGARAQDQSFNITLERDYADALSPVELAPQEMTRVFLNLFGNGFYAAHKRAQANAGGAYRPTLHVATRDAGNAVEIAIRDNGTGIPAEIRDRLFQPFFTTKPTGEGTGLGLSISYDIVTQQHGGTIAVASEEGAYTEFTIRLPRN